MIFLELIRVQSSEPGGGGLEDNIWELVKKELEEQEPTRGRVFFRLGRQGEAMVMLMWEQDRFDQRGSDLARLLVSELKKHGLVNYSAWAEGPCGGE